MIDYKKYELKTTELILCVAQWSILVLIIGKVFYNSFFASILLFAGFPLFLKAQKEELVLKRKRQLNLQFKDAIKSVASALTAGYSIENSFIEAYKDLRFIYDDDAIIVREFDSLVRGLEVNITLESLINSLAKRSEDEDICLFSEVFSTAKRFGGDIIGIIKMTADNISGKIEVKREIEVAIAAKQFEQKIMNIIPIFIIAYVRLSSPGFFDIMYGNIKGIILMTICLVIYIVAYVAGKKIVNIEV